MKTKGILIVLGLIVIGVAAYFMFGKKDASSDKSITTTTTNNAGVASLLDTSAISSLFGGILSKKSDSSTADKKAADKTEADKKAALSAVQQAASMFSGI